MNWWMIVAISAVTTTYVQADTCDKCKSAYNISAQSCTEATTYLTCAIAARNPVCTDTDKTTAITAVSDNCTCSNCSTIYHTHVAATDANKCTVADRYVTCLNGVKDNCGPTTLAKTKAAAATKTVEFCNSAGSLTVSMVFTSLMMAAVSSVRV